METPSYCFERFCPTAMGCESQPGSEEVASGVPIVTRALARRYGDRLARHAAAGHRASRMGTREGQRATSIHGALPWRSRNVHLPC